MELWISADASRCIPPRVVNEYHPRTRGSARGNNHPPPGFFRLASDGRPASSPPLAPFDSNYSLLFRRSYDLTGRHYPPFLEREKLSSAFCKSSRKALFSIEKSRIALPYRASPFRLSPPVSPYSLANGRFPTLGVAACLSGDAGGGNLVTYFLFLSLIEMHYRKCGVRTLSSLVVNSRTLRSARV